LHVCDAIFVPKGELYLAECIESSSVKTYLLLQRLLDEVALIDGYFSFSRHLASSQTNVVLAVDVAMMFAGTENAAGAEKREGAGLARLFILDSFTSLQLIAILTTSNISKTSETPKTTTNTISVIPRNYDDRP
jgi:hypothetical protein